MPSTAALIVVALGLATALFAVAMGWFSSKNHMPVEGKVRILSPTHSLTSLHSKHTSIYSYP